MQPSEAQELHRLYNKHEVTGPVYNGPDDFYPFLTQCSCGDFLVYCTGSASWEPLYGQVAAGFLKVHPELYEPMRAYWESLPKMLGNVAPVSWHDVEAEIPHALLVVCRKQAAILDTPKSPQGTMKAILMPMSYTAKDIDTECEEYNKAACWDHEDPPTAAPPPTDLGTLDSIDKAWRAFTGKKRTGCKKKQA